MPTKDQEQHEGVPATMQTRYRHIAPDVYAEIVAMWDLWKVGEWYHDQMNISDKTWIVPDNTEWWIHRIHVYMGTSAVVGTRQLSIAVYRATGTVQDVLAIPGITQAASLARFYEFAPGLADLTAVRDTNFVTTPLPTRCILNAGDRLRIWDNKVIDLDGDSLFVTMHIATRAVQWLEA